MKEKIKKPIIYLSIATILLIIFIITVFTYGGGAKSGASVFEVKRGSITSSFNTVGQVKPKEGVDLAFERSGKVSGKYFNIGDKVSAGKTLVSLENYDLVANLHQAEANLKIQQARLDELKRGARSDDLEIQNNKVLGANNALTEAKRNLIDKIQDAYTKSDDAVRGKTDQLFSNPRSASPKLTFTVADAEAKDDIEFRRMILEDTLNKWYLSLASVSVSKDLSEDTEVALSNLNNIKIFLDKLASVVNALFPSAQVSSATLTGWRSDISIVRGNINLAISNMTLAKEKFEAAKMNYDIAKNQRNLILSGATDEQIRAQEGQVEAAKASIESARAQIAKTIIRAPFNGEIAKDDVIVGQIVSPNAPLISLVSNTQFDIQVNIPESNISEIGVGDSAKVTLDAYGNQQIFDAKIISLDSAQTIVDGVPVYRARLQFVSPDTRIKAGMTANVIVLSGIEENALIVPGRAVFKREDKDIVFVVNKNSTPEERAVVVGIKGSDGNVQIISGLIEGEKVFVY